MKNLRFLFALLVVLLFAACNRKTPIVTYRLEGISELTIDSHTNSTDTLRLMFYKVDNNAEQVSFYISGLPQGISVDATHQYKGIPPFNSTIVFTNDGTAKAGDYHLTINCFVATIPGSQINDVLLRILSPGSTGNCDSLLVGDWPDCNIDTGKTIYGDMIIVDKLIPHRISLQNGNATGFPILADLDCLNNALSIVHITRIIASGTHYYSGSGTFSPNLINYSFQDSTSGRVQRYNVTMRR